MKLTWDEAVVAELAKGFDIHYGARSIIYEVERRVRPQILLHFCYCRIGFDNNSLTVEKISIINHPYR